MSSQDGRTSVAAGGGEADFRARVGAVVEAAGMHFFGEAMQAGDLGVNGGPLGALVVRHDGAIGRLRSWVEQVPDVAIIAVCRSVSGSIVRKAVTAGAAGVVHEDELERALGPAITAALAGQVSVPQAAGRHLERPALTAREKQILGLVVLGFTNAEIANRLHLAESTVKSHLSAAFSKLGVSSRAEAAAVVLDPEERLGPGILAMSEAEEDPNLAVGAWS